ncbi:MAG: TIGR02452 family protein [Deltaproteobacteria bacterium]|nr:TIGR02452 family protein [Deltaproteobacteria bacterium]
MTRNGRAALAAETLSIIERGNYLAPSGVTVSIESELTKCHAGTVLYAPDALAALQRSIDPLGARSEGVRIEVTGETTSAALRRLVQDESCRHVMGLNFASAKNPGGGFLGGAKAQEEDLARGSSLYASLITKPAYYEQNRSQNSLLYTDHAIYSPGVVFFRGDEDALLERPFVASVLTMPAPNAGEHRKRYADDEAAITETMARRIAQVFAVARHHGDRTLVLGAWGCGVFRNEPNRVAECFAQALAHHEVTGAIARVVFAVYDRAGGPNRAAFDRRFAGA